MIAHRGLGSLLFLAVMGAAGCGTDGTTPSCDDYPLPYDIRVAARRAEVWERLEGSASEPSACTILPAGYGSGGGGATAGAGSGGESNGAAGFGGGGQTSGAAGFGGADAASGAGGSPE